jgi:hypothetical protein
MDASVVDEHVETPELVAAADDRIGYGTRISDVRSDGQRAASMPCDVAGDTLDLGVVAIEENDRGARVGEGFGCGAPDPARRPGDQRNVARELPAGRHDSTVT